MHSFFAEVAQGVSRRMRDSGYNIVIAYPEEDAEVERQEIEGLIGRCVDGLIIVLPNCRSRPGSSSGSKKRNSEWC